jgi:hypothetical protein
VRARGREGAGGEAARESVRMEYLFRGVTLGRHGGLNHTVSHAQECSPAWFLEEC